MPSSPWAHPRSRGENVAARGDPAFAGGSSPLTRGKLDTVIRETNREGLIPAHAGKTDAARRAQHPSTAHPRSRGENQRGDVLALPAVGSSPLTRGKRTGNREQGRTPRLIPAHAGKTRSLRLPCLDDRAHPRSRGENIITDANPLSRHGSSPLTRGKRGCVGWRARRARLIPAHAGKTQPFDASSYQPRAHPRSRGENRSTRGTSRNDTGSSPLTRGKQPASAYLVFMVGLIPAHAGKTRRNPGARANRRAHPRSRGENAAGIEATIRDEGSSPLTRGKLSSSPSLRLGGRLIPAHAGKTTPQTPKHPAGGAHPRSRGENSWSLFVHPLFEAHPRSRGENVRPKPASAYLVGSSPLTRGKLDAEGPPALRGRLIPAHAGKTGAGRYAWRGSRAHPRSRGENPS